MEDVITALATPWGEGGIAVVRLSGEGSVEIADKIFLSRQTLFESEPRKLVLGKIYEQNSSPFDEILAVRFEKGKSYTGEESVEFHCHGGTASAQKCIEVLCSLGARAAMPGEFTRRAFVNGRIDLSQAEAVLGIIRAKSDEALKASARTLQGGFACDIKEFLSDLTILAAKLEVDLDFPEEGEGLLPKAQSAEIIESLLQRGSALLNKCRSGLLLREGIKTAIVGRPNVGKSSLLNSLLKEERAIVTPIPGTTRDRIEETFIHKGIAIRIIDTAGIRETEDKVEAIGVDTSRRSMNDADLRIWVTDAAEHLTEDDILLGSEATSLPHLIVINKCDLESVVTPEIIKEHFPNSRIISVSTLKSQGIEELKDIIVEKAAGGDLTFDGYGVTSRQMECLASAITLIKEAQKTIYEKIGDDVTIACISEARGKLSSLLGLDASEELLDTVFGTFCVGK